MLKEIHFMPINICIIHNNQLLRKVISSSKISEKFHELKIKMNTNFSQSRKGPLEVKL